MGGNSESYTQRIEAMRSNLHVDELQLEKMIRSGEKLDLYNRDRATLEREIREQKRRIAIASAY